ncbi:antifreeze protein Maxi-like [Panicum miliaceum]|uniref:Antifreeze protein Maxi-like n=1 Tax=Panicum miliaceum TaxID=4540 RepID=A0A3L6SXJ4_PANMI|nr:antifreeze protein Maxi-like [Panicum miliaceum]
MASGASSPAHAAAVLVLLLLSSAGAGEAAAAAAAALDEVCGRLGGYYVTPALCASALCADPSAPCRAARDAPAVAALAARLAADNATAARDSIEAVLSSSPSPPSAGPASAAAAGNSSAAASAAAAARSCLQLYAGAVPALRWAARAGTAARGRCCRRRSTWPPGARAWPGTPPPRCHARTAGSATWPSSRTPSSPPWPPTDLYRSADRRLLG